MKRKSIHRVAATAALVMTAGACTSSSQKATDTTTTATSPVTVATTGSSLGSSTTTGSTSVDPHTFLLRLADLPSGIWKSASHNTDPNRRAYDVYYDTCLGIPTIDDNESAVYYSDFTRSDNQAFANSEVDVVKSTAYASRDFAALEGPKAISCILASAKHDFADQNKTATNKLTAERASVIDAPKPFFGVRLNATFSSSTGRAEAVLIDTYYLQRGDAEIQVQFVGFGSSDTTTAASALATLAKRTHG